MSMQNVMDDDLEGTITTYDHRLYKVTFNCSKGTSETTTSNYVAKTIPHLILSLDKEQHSRVNLIKSIEELGYAPNVFVFINRERIIRDIHQRKK